VLSWHVQEEKGQEIIFPEVGFKWNELGQLAQKFYYDYKNINDYNALLRLLDKNKNDIIKLIEGFSNEALYEVTWYGKYTRGRMIQLNTSSPYKNASGRLTALLKKLGR
ncbi:MAG: ClbS/DfsB family four-helix bundle protein, partial [Snodgrassella sp.]|nr:ClbS/DfsB family four-helix bundle protein [Snodgrassella sp.]